MNPISGLSQTSFILGAIVFAFLVFITLRGELPAYLALIVGGAPPAPVTTPPATTTTGTVSTAQPPNAPGP